MSIPIVGLLLLALASVTVSAVVLLAAALFYARGQRRKRIYWQNECARITQDLRTRTALAGDQEATPCT